MKKLAAVFLVVGLLFASLVGCNTPAPSSSVAQGGSGASSGAGASSGSGETLTIDIYDVAANYQGMQSGWFQKVVMDRFNMELNIIAPQVAGEAIFQTRASSGNLGDLLILENIQFSDCVQAGLVKDISAEIGNYSNLMEYKDQIEVFNGGLPDNDAGVTYGIPAQMTNTSPTSYSQEVIYSSPMLRWDLYKEAGAPKLDNLTDLLDVLEDIMKANPTNADGDPAYPFSLWADWDGGDGMLGIANVVQLTTWYGEKIKGSVILKPDDSFTPITDKSASYYKLLKFLNDAYQRGLVDPDSGTQDWNSVSAKLSAGQVYLMWYSWQAGFWNSTDRLQEGTAFRYIPVSDQTYYADSDTYFGSGRVFGIGSLVEGEKYERIMEFLDWYASPEGLMFAHNGIEGFNYEKGDDGRLYRINDTALMDNLPVPEEYGGGGYQDGNNAINQWLVDAISINPLTGEPYSGTYWSTYKEATMTDMKREWTAMFGAEDDVAYMKANNKLLVSPNVSVSLPSDSADISVIRNQCNEALCDYSWRMIFATSDSQFDAMWDELTTHLDGFDFQSLVAFDTEKHQIELDAKNSAK